MLNPVRARTVKHPNSHVWSSYRATAGLSDAPEFLTRDWLLSQFGRRRRHAEKRYRHFVANGIGQPSPWDQLTGQILLGSEPFVKKMTRKLKETETLAEIPRRQRFAARPSLKTLFPEGGFKDKDGRDRIIRQAHAEYGYSLSEIGRTLELHYTTISKVVNRDEA